MRKTYAYNSIIIGALLGITVGASTKSVVWGIVVGLAVSVVGFIIIKLVENALYAAANKATKKAQDAYQRRKARKIQETDKYDPPTTTRFPGNNSSEYQSNANGNQDTYYN